MRCHIDAAEAFFTYEYSVIQKIFWKESKQMRKSLLSLIVAGLVGGMSGTASAHIGESVYLIYEIPDSDLSDIDIRDISVADWEDVVGDAPLVTTDFYQDPTVGEGAQYDPADLDYRIWVGWNGNSSTIYMAMERVDNVYINEYAGGDLGQLWRHDAIEFMLDGDHTGGDYTGSADENWTDDEKLLNNNRTAQQYVAIADTPDGRHVGYQGAGAEWVNALPYADGGGGSVGEGPTTSIFEFYVTPFDDLIWNSPDDSQATNLVDGGIIGFQVSVPDFDIEPSNYRAFHTLSGQAATWRYAERFVDGRLVGAGGGGTAVESDSWGRIKASVE